MPKDRASPAPKTNPFGGAAVSASSEVVFRGESGYLAGVSRERTKVRAGRPVPDGRHHLLVPLSLFVTAVAYYGLHLSFAVVIGIAVAFSLLYFFLPGAVQRSREAFDRDALGIRASGPKETRAARLEARLELARLFRIFGAPADVHARRAMIAEEAGQPKLARAEYDKALAAWEGEVPLATLVGHANASYLARDDVDAVVDFQKVLERDSMLPRLHLRLAHATLRAGLPIEGVAGWLTCAERDADSDDARQEVQLVRALERLAHDDVDAARALVDGVAAGAAHRELRDEVERALEARREALSQPGA